MKTTKEIRKQIQKNRDEINAMTEEIIRLDYKEEKRAAAHNNGIFKWKELHEKAKENAGKIVELSEKIYIAEIKSRILSANYRAALVAEATPVIISALAKYDGKPYGEKTAEKIRAEVKAAGYGFYFEGYHNSRISIYELGADGYRTPAGREATAAAYDEAGHIVELLTEENKINVKAGILKPWKDTYTENPAKEAAKVAKMIRAYAQATKDLEKMRIELSAVLPDGITSPEYVKEYYVRF